MKKTTKALLLVLCAMLLVAASVLGTLAFLTSSDSVTNTFTVGKVGITLDETDVDLYGKKDGETRVKTNKYKLIPGHTYTKDPTITVASDSEDCWLFVKVENGLGSAATISWAKGWTRIGETDYWAYSTAASKNENVSVFSSFTFNQSADPADYESATIVVTAYAIQSDGFKTSDDAWTALKGQLGLE